MNQVVNAYEITEKMYLQWILETKKEGKHLVFTIIKGALILFSLLCYFLLGKDIFFILIALFGAYMVLPRDLVIGKKMFQRSLALQGTSTWKRIITVTETEIICEDGNSITNIKTSNIVKITHNDARIRVFLNNNTSIRLYKNAFIEGTWQDCLNILNK